MELSIALLLFMHMILFLWEAKADIYFIIFIFATFMFFIIFILILNPIGSLSSIASFFMVNPIVGILLLISPLVAYTIIEKIKRRYSSKNKKQ